MIVIINTLHPKGSQSVSVFAVYIISFMHSYEHAQSSLMSMQITRMWSENIFTFGIISLTNHICYSAPAVVHQFLQDAY